MGVPYFSQMPLRCGKCETRWMEWQPNNCRFEVWIAAADALKCPKCEAGQIAGRLMREAEATYAR